MRVLLLHSHPVESSFGRALHDLTLESLRKAGHEVDDCNLYEEGFDPVMSRHDRLVYHDYPENTKRVGTYVERLQKAEAIVIVTPVWNFGFPAILKGWIDRVWVKGVTFDLENGKLSSKMTHIQKFGVVFTYGATRWNAFLAGNPPKKIVTRWLRAHFGLTTPALFLAHYDMNNCTPETRQRFMDKVQAKMEVF